MIPDDIKEKAIAAFHEAMKFNTDHESEAVIAQAILAERQRCAAVARANAHAECEVVEQIEQAILNP